MAMVVHKLEIWVLNTLDKAVGLEIISGVDVWHVELGDC